MQSTLIIYLNTMMASSTFWTQLVPILSDIFVFSYPCYLLYLYFVAHDHDNRWRSFLFWHQDRKHKYEALTIFSSFVLSIVINYSIKWFVEQARPYKVLDLLINPQESLILESIPHDSFPSDHAAVGMTIAICVILLAYRENNTKKILFWRLFLVFALIMDISRITIGVHRPSDIIAGSIVWWLSAYLMTRPQIGHYVEYYIFWPLVDIQEKIVGQLKRLITK